MDCPNHGSANRGAQGMPGLTMRSDCQDKAALPDDDFASPNFDCLGAQIGGKSVFFSVQKHNTDDSGEMKTAQRNICDGEHQRPIRVTALCPCVFAGKRMSPVAFHIADGIMEHIGRAIDGKHPIHRVTHAENAVSALHKGNIPKWPHNVIPDWREWTEPNRAGDTEVGYPDVQRDALFSKSISGDAHLIVLLQKTRVGERRMERM